MEDMISKDSSADPDGLEVNEVFLGSTSWKTVADYRTNTEVSIHFDKNFTTVVGKLSASLWED